MRDKASLSSLLSTIVLSVIATGCGGTANVGASDTYGSGGSSGEGSGGKGSGGVGSGGSGSGGIGSGGIAAGGSGSGGFAGTVSSGGTGGTPPGESVTPLCNEAVVALTEGLNPVAPVDYLAVFIDQGSGPVVYETSGTLCSGATNPQSCQTAFGSLAVMTGFLKTISPPQSAPQIPYFNFAYLAFTRGDEVGAITDDAGLSELLGTIDTPNEAALAIFLHGVALPCTTLTETPDGYYAYFYSFVACSSLPPGLSIGVTRSGQVTSTPVGVGLGPCVGRRPTGLAEARACDDASALGRYYAEVAHLEAAAVVAFEVMADELEHFGAPEELVARAKRAQQDEVRHARQMGALAQRHGATVQALDVAPARRRNLFEMALENAVEGCVRETWGALSAHWQAAAARDDAARAVWQKIAADEAEHAELSLALHDWIVERLSVEQRALLAAAKEQAVSDLAQELANDPDPELVRAAGVPSREVAAKLSVALRERLWAKA